MINTLKSIALVACLMFAVSAASAIEDSEIKLTSAGPIAFGPDGLLLVSDPMAATIYAVETGDTEGSTDGVKIEIQDVRSKVAAMMGADSEEVVINDLAVNPVNGSAYLSVTRGQGDDQDSVIVRVDGKTNELGEFDMSDVKFTKTELNNAADDKKDRRGQSQRMQSITDLAFVDGQVYVAGLSNEEFASNLRAIRYPFSEVNDGASIEIYHGAHGQFETRSPIRTFAAYMVEEDLNLLAAYTCTPLVRIPVESLKPDEKVQGTTIAELGNRNRPLDMVVYKKDDKDYCLMANSDRGVMKIDLDNTATQAAITERVGGSGTAGLTYETIKDLKGVMQLDGLGSKHAVILVRSDSGQEDLKTIELP